eukprot:896694-Rhodomonas_salina.1
MSGTGTVHGTDLSISDAAEIAGYCPTMSYEMSGTDIAHGSIALCMPYAMSGAGIVHGTDLPIRTDALYGTDLSISTDKVHGTDLPISDAAEIA